ncbi:extracellular solute-binding protein, partial [Streptomyces hirsutus]
MKLSVRLVALAAVIATAACAPQTSGDSSSGKDEKTGTLRVWLFQEVNNAPKEKVVESVVAGFEKAHDGTEVTVEYIPVETRAERIKAAFNDPKSAPDLVEYGNTDTAGYVKDGGLADVTEEFGAWDEAKDTDPTARQSVTVDGKVYG